MSIATVTSLAILSFVLRNRMTGDKGELDPRATLTGQNLVPAVHEGHAGAVGYLTAVLLLPLLVLWHQDNALFTGYGYADPWIYFGYFRNLVEFKRNLFVGDPHGNHLSWILPGAALHTLFTPVTATCLLHLGVHTLATTSLFLTLKWLSGTRQAFVTAMVFSFNPWLWAATGWDYVDGIGIAYCLLTMALLTWAALVPSRRWALLAAGMSLAALLDTGAGWLPLALLFPLYYTGLMWSRHRTEILRSFFALCGWFGAGGLITTAAFSAINHFLDGRPFQQTRLWTELGAAGIVVVVLFFVRRTISRGISGPVLFSLLLLVGLASIALLLITGGNRSPSTWRYGLWEDGPSPWLLFPLVAAVTALVVLYSQRRRWPSGFSAPTLLSLQLLCALACMTYSQLRGRPELGGFDFANKLLPFSFLVIGAGFWPEAEKVSLLDYLNFCCAAAITLGYAWLDEGMILVAGMPYAPWFGAAALVLALFLRRLPEYLVCSLFGFFVLTAIGTGARYGGIDAHAFRDQLQSLSMARDRIEIARQGKPVRFWYDDKDAAMPSALALNWTYLGGSSLLSRSFAKTPCDFDLAPSTVLVVIATDALHGPDFAAPVLSACWNEKGRRAVPIEVDTFHQGSSGYEMSLLRIEAAPGAVR
jgi:hypothetical protein